MTTKAKITLNVEFESTDSSAVVHTLAYLKALGANSVGADVKMLNSATESVEEEEKPKRQPRNSAKPPAKESKELKKPEEDEEENSDEGETSSDSGSDFTLDDLREMMAPVLENNRQEIKKQLQKLGASGLSSLDPNKYGVMGEFFKTLK